MNHSNHTDTQRRSMSCARRSLGAIVLTLVQAVAYAESPVLMINAEAAKAEISVENVRGGISMLSGSGGNIAVLETAEGKLLVDAGIALSRQRIEAALGRLGPGRPQIVINSHWHWDHTNGNGWLREAGATIIAHPETLALLAKRVRVDDWQFTFDPLPEAARPTSLVATERTLEFGGARVLVRYYGPAHTSGDLYVYFANEDVLVTGDTYWNGVYPFIDTAAGGSIDGMIQAADRSLARATANTRIVPGHGAVASRGDLQAFRDMLVAIRNNVAALKQQGMTLEQVIAARPTADFDERWGGFVIDPAFFTKLVYRGT
jgi:glyoxylase-like metal-dependent hydrolase (beta-lactamase superfamily II)